MVAFILFSVVMLPLRNGVFLRWMEDMSFHDTSAYSVALMFDYPGGMLQMVGSYLTQLMYYPWMGSAVLISIWVLTIWVTVRVFRLGRHASLLAFIPPVALLASIIVVDEVWITIPSRGYIFSQSVGFAISVLFLWAYRYSEYSGVRWVMALFILLTFPLFGFYSLFGWLLTAIVETAESLGRRRPVGLVLPFSGLLAAVLLPVVYYYFWNGCWAELEGIWLKGLPDLAFTSDVVKLWIPFIVMTAGAILMGIVSSLRQQRESGRSLTVYAGLLAVSVVWCAACSVKPEQFRALVLMEHYMQQNKWGRVRAIMDNIKETPSAEMVLIAHLADNLLGMESSAEMPHDESTDKSGKMRRDVSFRRTALLSVPLNYYIGRRNLSYRWAMEHTVKFGKRVFYLKYMMKCALLGGEYDLARRYNDMLRSTLFHRSWAEHYRRFIDNPALMKNDPEFRAIPPDMSSDIFF